MHSLCILNALTFLSITAWLGCHHQCVSPISSLLQHLYTLKYTYLTLPLSLSICVLYTMRKITWSYHRHRPQTSQLKQFCMTVLYIALSIAAYCVLFLLSSIALDLVLNAVWVALVIHRMYNLRFCGHKQQNNKFWRSIIQFVLDDDDNDTQTSKTHLFQRLFAVNSVLASKAQYFPNARLSAWMNTEYVDVFYHKRKGLNMSKFASFGRQSHAQWVLVGEAFINYFSDHETLDNVDQFFFDFVNCLNICNVIQPWLIAVTSQVIYSIVYSFTLFGGMSLYALSVLATVLFPMAFLVSVGYFEVAQWHRIALPVMFSVAHVLFVAVLGWLYWAKFRRITGIIWSLAPGYYGKNEMFMPGEEQQEVLQSIVWYYRAHSHAPEIATYLFRRFGADITGVIVMYLPATYAQETAIEA